MTETANVIGKPSAEMNTADLAFPICQNCVMSSSIMIRHTEAPTMEALAPHECMDQAEGGGKKADNVCIVSLGRVKSDEVAGNG